MNQGQDLLGQCWKKMVSRMFANEMNSIFVENNF